MDLELMELEVQQCFINALGLPSIQLGLLLLSIVDIMPIFKYVKL
jgi:hypothetical protein